MWVNSMNCKFPRYALHIQFYSDDSKKPRVTARRITEEEDVFSFEGRFQIDLKNLQ